MLVLIIWFKLFVGKNPPAETKVIERFKPLNNLTFEIVKKIKIKMVIKKYIKKILREIFLILISGFKLLSALKTNLFNL